MADNKQPDDDEQDVDRTNFLEMEIDEFISPSMRKIKDGVVFDSVQGMFDTSGSSMLAAFCAMNRVVKSQQEMLEQHTLTLVNPAARARSSMRSSAVFFMSTPTKLSHGSAKASGNVRPQLPQPKSTTTAQSGRSSARTAATNASHCCCFRRTRAASRLRAFLTLLVFVFAL